jgi:hypothetical protein
MPRYVRGSARNISPFREDEEIQFPHKDTINLDDDDDNTYGSNPRFSFQPNGGYPDSPPSIYDTAPARARSVFARNPDLSLDKVAQNEDKNVGRAELWAPAGKLGVAIDVVDGHPIVWRIKAGSPLDGFLQKGDTIMAIDEIDTFHMSAADVTSVMVRRMRQRRKITYIRP